MIHVTRKQSLQSYGLPLGKYAADQPSAPLCPICHLEAPLFGPCC